MPLDLNLSPWRGQNLTGKIVYIILIAVILGAVGVLGYLLATPGGGERFTEFYVLGLEGKATDYPQKLKMGEEGRVIVGVINREHETVSYCVKVRIDGVINNQVGPLELGHDEKWEEVVSFTPHRAGDGQKVEFLLYRDKEGEPYQEPLHLWINVEE